MLFDGVAIVAETMSMAVVAEDAIWSCVAVSLCYKEEKKIAAEKVLRKKEKRDNWVGRSLRVALSGKYTILTVSL